MKSFFILLFCSLFIGLSCKNSNSSHSTLNQSESDELLERDSVVYHTNFPSQFVDSRNVEVWLPTGYTKDNTKTFKVLYMHDGQNVLNDRTSYTGIEWGVDETLDSLIQTDVVKPTVVVAIWNNGLKRFPEYMPQIPQRYIESPQAKAALRDNFGVDNLLSDNYLKFIVEELKPFIDSTYNVSREQENTAIMGSSMGGLISLYAISKYPDVFGAAGCVSTHWPVPMIGEVYMEQVSKTLPDPKTHKIYFDYGTKTLDAEYEPYQKRVDNMMRKKGFIEGQNWITRKFEGAAHDELSWKKRAAVPLTFLLK